MNKFDLLVESVIAEAMQVGKKDWDRMMSLVLKDDNGSKVAKTLKNKDKAIARFIAGSKLENASIDNSSFWPIKDKAIQLGASEEEILDMFNQTELPKKYIEDLNNLKTKKYNDRFVGDISKAVIDSGLNIDYLKHNGYALTGEGKNAMERNGRKWTIGYKAEINLGDRKVPFHFDAITDEGDGPTLYAVDKNNSDRIFHNISHWEVGKTAFIKGLKKVLKNE